MRQSRIYCLTSGDNNMNSLSQSKSPSGKCSTSANDENVVGDSSSSGVDNKNAAIKQNELIATDSSVNTTSASDSTTIGQHSPINFGKRHSLATQQMPEIQISNSDEQMKPRRSIAELYEHKETDNKSSSSDTDIQKTNEAAATAGGICGHYCAGWQPSIFQGQLSDEDLHALVMELKRKIEFTERMNWLCKYIKIVS